MKVKDLIKSLEKKDPEEEVYCTIVDHEELNDFLKEQPFGESVPILASQRILKTLDSLDWDPDDDLARAFWRHISPISCDTLDAKYLGAVPRVLADKVLLQTPTDPTKTEIEEFLGKLTEIHMGDTYSPEEMGHEVLDGLIQDMLPEDQVFIRIDARDYYRLKGEQYEN